MADIRPVAHIRSDFPDKFGIPRQSGLVPELLSAVIFQPEFRSPEALRGLESFSHLWLIWGFSAVPDPEAAWSPTVRPPKLGGNVRMGVFATRSPFRPNSLGLSSAEIARIEPHTADGPVLYLRGADLMDGTPIYDIKPYLPFTDSHPDGRAGFTEDLENPPLTVLADENLLAVLPQDKREALCAVLRQDPRPAYQSDPNRVYGVKFAGFEVRFSVDGSLLTVREIYPL